MKTQKIICPHCAADVDRTLLLEDAGKVSFGYCMSFMHHYRVGWTYERDLLVQALRRYRSNEGSDYGIVVRELVRKEFPDALFGQQFLTLRTYFEILFKQKKRK